MKYAAEMSSGAMICIPSFIKTRPSIQNLNRGGIHRDTDSMVISYAYFYFIIKNSRLKILFSDVKFYNYVHIL
jgi:hypothetical protein